MAKKIVLTKNISPLPPYVPNVAIDYPLNEPDKHILDDTEIDCIIDEHFKFVDDSFWFKIKSLCLYIFAILFIFNIQTIRFGWVVKKMIFLEKSFVLF